jgi:FKBP-type peptidyl-prolyl cis-trans isomerase FkpA
MIRNLITFSILLVIIASCAKTETPDVVDYGPIDKKIIEDYLLAHNDTTAQSTASGLYYIIQNPGGDIHPTINSVVKVNYKGYLTNGTIFDSSAASSPFEYGLGSLITGWQEGLQLIGAGGKITLFCPSALGYGSRAAGSIPANSVLIFEIELISFK